MYNCTCMIGGEIVTNFFAFPPATPNIHIDAPVSCWTRIWYDGLLLSAMGSASQPYTFSAGHIHLFQLVVIKLPSGSLGGVWDHYYPSGEPLYISAQSATDPRKHSGERRSDWHEHCTVISGSALLSVQCRLCTCGREWSRRQDDPASPPQLVYILPTGDGMCAAMSESECAEHHDRSDRMHSILLSSALRKLVHWVIQTSCNVAAGRASIPPPPIHNKLNGSGRIGNMIKIVPSGAAAPFAPM